MEKKGKYKAEYKKNDKIGQLKLAIAFELLPNLPPIQEGDYSLIVCDPPWQYELRENDSSHRGRCPYPSMNDDAILNMPVGAIASSNAYLLLWVTNNHLPLGFRCLEHWGFEYKSVFTWVKVTKKHSSENPSPLMGIGHYGRNTTEHFLVATKGNPGSFTNLGLTNIPNVIFEKRSQHSKKPQGFWTIADRLGEKLGGEKIELFARNIRPGWVTWGAEVQNNNK